MTLDHWIQRTLAGLSGVEGGRGTDNNNNIQRLIAVTRYCHEGFNIALTRPWDLTKVLVWPAEDGYLVPFNHADMTDHPALNDVWMAVSIFNRAACTLLIHCSRTSIGFVEIDSIPGRKRTQVLQSSVDHPFSNSNSMILLIFWEWMPVLLAWRIPFRCSHMSHAICHNFLMIAVAHILEDFRDPIRLRYSFWAACQRIEIIPSKKFLRPI
jgi:hypothetical protein